MQRIVRKLARGLGIGSVVWLAACQTLPPHKPTESEDDSPKTVELTVSDDSENSELSLHFPKPMIAMGQGREAHLQVPIRISPAVPCGWRWDSSQILRCSLHNNDNLTPATHYELTIEPGFSDRAGHPVESKSFSFESERPKFIGLEVSTWESPTRPQLELWFNQAVIPESISAHVFLKSVMGERIPLRVLPGSPNTREWSREVAYRVDWQRPLKPGRDYWVVAEPGLRPAVGSLPSQGEHIETFSTYGDFKFLEAHCEFYEGYKIKQFSLDKTCPQNAVVVLNFSARPDAKTLRELAQNGYFGRGVPELDNIADERSWPGERQNHQFGLRLSKFIAAKDYQLHLDEQIKDRFGRSLVNSKTLRWTTGHYSDSVDFPQNVVVMPAESTSDVAAIGRNAPMIKVDLTALKSPESKTTEVWEQKSLPKDDQTYQLPLDIGKRLDQKSGLVVARLLRPEIKNFSDTLLVSRTPYSAIGKFSSHEWHFWLTDIETAKPLVGARISLFRSDEKLSLSRLDVGKEMISDVQGQVSFPTSQAEDGHNFGLMLYVQTERASGFIPIVWNNRAIGQRSGDFENDPSRYLLSLKSGEKTFWGATDKPIYEPGETVHFQVFLRERQDNHLVVPAVRLSYQLRFLESMNEHVIWENKAVTFDALGRFAGEFRVPEGVNDGRIVLKISQGKEDDIDGFLVVEVASFKPPTYRVSVDPVSQLARPGQLVKVSAKAEYLSGGPYGDAIGELSAVVDVPTFRQLFPRYAEFDFGENGEDPWQSESPARYSGQLKVDSQGRLRGSLIPPETKAVLGNLRLVAGVRDAAGEWNYSPAVTTPYFRYEYFAGLKLSHGWLLVNRVDSMSVVVLNRFGKPVAGVPVSVVAQRLTDGYGSNSTILETIPLCQVTSGDEARLCSFQLKKEGPYRIATVVDNKYVHGTQLERWAYSSSFSSEHGEELQLNGDKERYKVGDTAHFKFHNPLGKARALVTLEREEVLKSWWQNIDTADAEIDVPITDKLAPGFSVNLELLPVGLSHYLKATHSLVPPYRSVSQRVKVDMPGKASEFSLKIASQDYRPGDLVRLDIEGKRDPNIRYLVAIFDAGLLDLNEQGEEAYQPDQDDFQKLVEDWKQPDSYQALNQWLKGDMEVEALRRSPESYMQMSVLYQEGAASIDSGEDVERIEVTGSRIRREDLGLPNSSKISKHMDIRRMGALPSGLNALMHIRRDFKETAYWNPDVAPGTDGHAQVQFIAPDSLTEWKVIVLAVDSRKITKKSLTFKTQQGLELREHLPSQLTEGDELQARFSLVSRRALTQTDGVLRADGPILGSSIARKINFEKLTPFKRQNFGILLTASGKGTLDFLAVAGNGKNSDALAVEIPVRSSQTSELQTFSGILMPGDNALPVTIPGDNVAAELGLSLTVSSSPAGNLAAVLDYQRQYPHQCWEQRLSRALSLALGQPREAMSVADLATIHDALASLYQFQGRNGGMAFWQGRDEYVDDSLSAYTYSALNELARLGYAVPEDERDELRSFLQSRVRERLTPNKPYDPDLLSDRALPQALAALGSELDISRDAKKTLLAEVGYVEDLLPEWLMAASRVAVLEPTKRGLAKRLLQRTRETGKQLEYTGTGFWLGGVNADRCEALRAALVSGAIDREVGLKWWEGILAGRTREGHFGDTQANAQCLWAVREFERHFPVQSGLAQVNLTMSGSSRVMDIPPGKIAESGWKLSSGMKYTTLDAQVDSNQPLYYELRLGYQREGRSAEAQSAGLNLQRRYLRWVQGRWQEVGPGTALEVGDWVKVELDLTNPIFRQHVAISDPVPGGLRPSALNLAAAALPGIGRPDDDYYFYERQLRPDTVHMYSDFLPAGEHRIAYLAQVIAAGRFLALPARAEAMYDETIQARTASRTLTVSVKPSDPLP